MFRLWEGPVLACSCLAGQFETANRTVESKYSLHGAGHAVLGRLYSRAHRIGDESASCFSRNLKKKTSILVRLVVVVVAILQPSLELAVFPKHELQGFTNDVGFRRVDEFGIPSEF